MRARVPTLSPGKQVSDHLQPIRKALYPETSGYQTHHQREAAKSGMALELACYVLPGESEVPLARLFASRAPGESHPAGDVAYH